MCIVPDRFPSHARIVIRRTQPGKSHADAQGQGAAANGTVEISR
jgi:hypothetical protein